MFIDEVEMTVDMKAFGSTIKGTRGDDRRGFYLLTTVQSNESLDAIRQLREQFGWALKSQAEKIEKLAQGLNLLQNGQRQLEEAAAQLMDPLETNKANGDKPNPLSPSNILLSVRNLAAATYADQVFASLAGEAARMNVRSVVFDVRGRAAWGSCACGFIPDLSDEVLKKLVIPLNQDGPFRSAVEKGDAVEISGETLAACRNVMANLCPALNARILLIPVRSAGSVAALLYADTSEKRDSALIDSLKLLAEFAGAQIDRLMGMSGVFAGENAAPHRGNNEAASKLAAPALETETEAQGPEAAVKPEFQQAATAETGLGAPMSELPAEEEALLSSADAAGLAGEPLAPSEAATTQPGEKEEKVHRDAQRFSRLLVSEIELYNKKSVEEGRKNRDLYQRLKKDIDRSRETYEKRFANTVASRVDYFHQELVRTLAENDPSLLGSGYPGPSV